MSPARVTRVVWWWSCVVWWCVRGQEEDAPRCPPAADGDADCRLVGGSHGDYQYEVRGEKIIISYDGSNYFHITCYEGTALDSQTLPHFMIERDVRSVTVADCSLPAGDGSLRAALAAINVSLVPFDSSPCKLTLSELRGERPLRGAHLAGLDRLTHLQVVGRRERPVALAADFLVAVPSLLSLRVQDALLERGALDLAPLSLQNLSLHRAGLDRLPQWVFSLPQLRMLSLVGTEEAMRSLGENVARMPALESVTLDAPSVPLETADVVSPALRSLTLRGWAETKPAALKRCASLRTLTVLGAAVEALPERWAAACALRRLAVERAPRLASVPALLLAGADDLEELVLKNTALERLQRDLFIGTPNLRLLDLSNNRLTTLPSDLFRASGALLELDLSGNELREASLRELSAAAALRNLNLSRNPLRDLCSSNQVISELSSLTNLQKLSLASTNVSIICQDWRHDMTNLISLDLQRTRISVLGRRDLEFNRTNKSTVWLNGTNVTGVLFEESDYNATERFAGGRVTVQLGGDSELECDCSMYWTWRAYRGLGREPPRTDVRPLQCAGRRPLRELPEDELTCPSRLCGALPAGCHCAARPEPFGARLLRVRCERASLTALPAPLRLPPNYSVDLLLAHNRIRLQAHDLPPRIRKLDLRDNGLSTLDAETAARIVEAREVKISMNPWECGCDHWATVWTLRNFSAAVVDYGAALCADGSALARASAEPCVALEPALLAAPALLVLGVACAVCLRSRESRLLVRALLDRLGLWPRGDDRDRADGCEYDAFVSFSHEDERYALELVKRLEGASPPYRLCLHYRDWVPGRWIPEQISESVVRSRRTVALVSSHFLRSTWARAEFREAHARALRDVTRRLVVVLLEERERLPLDEELRRYLALNTYVRWGDPWFWHKLRLALPRPRPHAAPAPTPAPVYSVPLRHHAPPNDTATDDNRIIIDDSLYPFDAKNNNHKNYKIPSLPKACQEKISSTRFRRWNDFMNALLCRTTDCQRGTIT